MAANTALAGGPVFEKDPYVKSSKFTSSTTANAKQDFIPVADVPTEGLRIDQISIANTETASGSIVAFFDNDASNSYLIGTVSVPANAGFDGTVALVDAMSTLAPTTGYLIMMPGHKLEIAVTVQPDSGKEVHLTARGGKLTA